MNSYPSEIQKIYHDLLASWTKRDAKAFAALFHKNGSLVGFDGSQVNGKDEILEHLTEIFGNHKTPAMIGKLLELKKLSHDSFVLRAVAGLIPDGQKDINPALNSIQSLVAAKEDGKWVIHLFQNTPAAFHGRPDLVESLSQDLRKLIKD